MTVVQSLTTYLLASGLLTVTPGLDTALVLRVSTVNGAKPAAGAGVGIIFGLLLWGGIVAVGLGSLLAASQVAYTGLRWAGALYLAWLGIRLLLKPRQDFDASAGDQPDLTGRQWMARGFLSNVLNPKIGVFYVTFLPQFIPNGVSPAGWTFLLASIHAMEGVLWFAILIAASAPLGKSLRRPWVIQALDRLTGGVFLAFGAKLALSKS